MSFLPLLFQRRCLARFRSESLGGVYHSAGHSVVNRQNKKPIHRDIKNRRELCSRFKMMYYVTALKFKDGTVVAPNHSLTVPKRIEWWGTVFSLSIPPALGGFAKSQSYIVFSCNPSFKGVIFYCTEHMFANAFFEKTSKFFEKMLIFTYNEYILIRFRFSKIYLDGLG